VNRCEDLLRFFVAASSLKMDHLRGNRTCCFEEVCRSERPASKQSLQFDNAALHKRSVAHILVEMETAARSDRFEQVKYLQLFESDFEVIFRPAV
jgi:hypothetical protein